MAATCVFVGATFRGAGATTPSSYLSVADAWLRTTGSLPPHMDATAPVNDRVAALLALMTTPEKVAQLLLPAFKTGSNYTAQVQTGFGATGLGSVYNWPTCPGAGCATCAFTDLACNAAAQDALQAAIVASSRLHVPLSISAETLHSAACGGAVFPITAALGASWDADLVRDVAAAIAREARITGVDRGFAPALGVFTDARFGRLEENFGEDPTLVATLGVAFADGHHGGERGGPSAYLPRDGLVTEATHFAAYGWGGRDGGAADMDDATLFDVYLRPWREFARAGGRGELGDRVCVVVTSSRRVV